MQEVVMEDSQVAALSAQLVKRIGQRRFDAWFKSEAQLCIEASCLTIRAASHFVLEWLRKNLAEDIRACWQGLIGQTGTVEYDVRAVAVENGAPTPPSIKPNGRAKVRE